jgi:hypothetical protein
LVEYRIYRIVQVELMTCKHALAEGLPIIFATFINNNFNFDHQKKSEHPPRYQTKYSYMYAL